MLGVFHSPTTASPEHQGTDAEVEFRDDVPLYYLPDAEGYVRQGADADSAIVSAWLFDPDGTMLEGPNGPVSHLICGGVYDWSTGLLYKGGRYFDPSLGIWLVLLPLVVIQAWPGRRRKQSDKNPTLSWLVRLVLVAICTLSLLTACNNEKEALERACIDVKIPTLTSIEIISVQDIQLFPVPNGAGDWRVQFGNRVDSASDTNMLPGIVIEAKLEAQTEVNGTLEWVQDVITKRIQERTDVFVKLTDSPQRFAYGDGKRALDTWDPYKAAEDLIIDSAGVFSSKIWDSPGLPLPLLPPLKYVMIEDSFRSFVMWRPTGLNCRLPLGMIEWEWQVEIENTETEEEVPQVANWVIVSQSIPKVGTLGGKTDQVPTLSPNVTEFEWHPVP